MRMSYLLLAVVFPFTCIAQAIEKMKITDTELSCAQIYAEIGEMDKIIGDTKGTRDTSANTATAVDVAQQAGGHAANAAAMAGNYGGALGIARAMPFVGMFGSVAKGVSETKQRESGERLGEAKARKEHLTSLFIGKSCKASELKPAESPAAPNAPAAQGTPPTQSTPPTQAAPSSTTTS